jgi:hypothetical protein
LSQHIPDISHIDLSRSVKKSSSSGVSREQIARLIMALGDPEHPDHAGALEAIVEIGPPAVPLLRETLKIQEPWLPAYRAAEALGRIGDGRATGRLLQTLHHPNSNVRWSAVRALAQIGDVRAILELRRLVQHDHGRTSWGESVAGAAQSALDQIQTQSVWAQSLELIKTAITSILMILSLILAFSVVTTLRNELVSMGLAESLPSGIMSSNTVVPSDPDGESGGVGIAAGDEEDESESASATETAAAGDEEGAEATEEDAEGAVQPDPRATRRSLSTTGSLTGTILSSANVRPSPSVRQQPVGVVHQGTKVIFLSVSPDGTWYHIRLDEENADNSFIDNPDEEDTGWIHRCLVSDPDEDLPVEEYGEEDEEEEGDAGGDTTDDASDDKSDDTDDTTETTDTGDGDEENDETEESSGTATPTDE